MSDIYGVGVLKALRLVLRHFAETYIDDFRWLIKGKKRYGSHEGIQHRSGKDATGIFTIKYPYDEKLPVPEEFRFIPFLVYEEKEDGTRVHRCTSCGICAKVCPPQCIWIERSTDPNTGRPIPEPAQFYIDIDICMSCGFCAEFCPFDSIKMGHDYELAVLDRKKNNIYDKEKLSRPVSHYAAIRPTNYAREEAARAEAEAAKAARKAA